MKDPVFSDLWAAFRASDRDRVVVGVAAAFAHVATADLAIAPAEAERFLDVVVGSRLAPADSSSLASLRLAFDGLTQAMLARPAVGKTEALAILGDFGFDPVRSEIIWSATRTALIADSVLDAAERVAADEIRTALRIRSGSR